MSQYFFSCPFPHVLVHKHMMAWHGISCVENDKGNSGVRTLSRVKLQALVSKNVICVPEKAQLVFCFMESSMALVPN